MDAEVAPMVPNAQSAPNEVHIYEPVADDCQTHDLWPILLRRSL
jgi:hypothetical protein